MIVGMETMEKIGSPTMMRKKIQMMAGKLSFDVGVHAIGIPVDGTRDAYLLQLVAHGVGVGTFIVHIVEK